MTRLRLLAVVAVLLGGFALPDAALACNGWNEPSMETQLMCIVCHERLDQSNSPFATQVKQHLVSSGAPPAGPPTASGTRWSRSSASRSWRRRPSTASTCWPGWCRAPRWPGGGRCRRPGVGLVALPAGAARAGGGGGAVDPAMDARIDADLAGFE